MQLARSDAVAVFEGLGRKAAAGWKKSQMEANIKSLPEMVDESSEIGDKRLDDLLDHILGALAEGEDVILVADHVAALAADAAEGSEGDAQVAQEENAMTETKQRPRAKAAAKDAPKGKTAKAEGRPARAAKAKEATPKSSKPTRAPREKKDSASGVRMSKSAPYVAGVLIKKYGLKHGVTDEMAQEAGEALGRNNGRQDLFNLRNAWHAIQGYLRGSMEV